MKKISAEKRESIARRDFLMGSCHSSLKEIMSIKEEIDIFIEYLVDLREKYHKEKMVASDDHFNKNFVETESRRLAIAEIQAILKNIQ